MVRARAKGLGFSVCECLFFFQVLRAHRPETLRVHGMGKAFSRFGV